MIGVGVANLANTIKSTAGITIIVWRGIRCKHDSFQAAVWRQNTVPDHQDIALIGIVRVMAGFTGHPFMFEGNCCIFFDMAAGTNGIVVGGFYQVAVV